MLTISKIQDIMNRTNISELNSSNYKFRELLFKHASLKMSSWNDNWRASSMPKPCEKDSITYSKCIKVCIIPTQESHLSVRLSIWDGDSLYGMPMSRRCEFYFNLSKSFKLLEDLLYKELIKRAEEDYTKMLEKQKEDFLKSWVASAIKGDTA